MIPTLSIAFSRFSLFIFFFPHPPLPAPLVRIILTLSCSELLSSLLFQSASRRLNIVDLTPRRSLKEAVRGEHGDDDAQEEERQRPKVHFRIDPDDDGEPGSEVALRCGPDELSDGHDARAASDNEGSDDEDEDADLNISLSVPERVKPAKPGAEAAVLASSTTQSAATSNAATRDVSRVASAAALVSLTDDEHRSLTDEDHERLQESAPRLSSKTYTGPSKAAVHEPLQHAGGLTWCTLRPVHFDMQGQMSPLNSRGSFGWPRLVRVYCFLLVRADAYRCTLSSDSFVAAVLEMAEVFRIAQHESRHRFVVKTLDVLHTLW